jgi:hypothetical protein
MGAALTNEAFGGATVVAMVDGLGGGASGAMLLLHPATSSTMVSLRIRPSIGQSLRRP